MRLTLLILVALVVVAASARRVDGQAADDPAVRAALHRQEVVKTAYIEFKQVEVIAKGGAAADAPAMFRPAKPIPDKETTLESHGRFIIDGEKLRYEDNHPTWHVPDGTLQKKTVIGFSDGVTAKSFFQRGMNGESNPVGIIDKGPRQEMVKSYVLTPITMAFRGDNPSISPFTLSEMKPTGQTSFFGGLPCQEYVIEYSPDVRVGLLLDPEKNYVVRRIRTQNKGRITKQTDIEYRANDTVGWIPSSWIFNVYSGDGITLRTTKVEVSELRINEPQPADLFGIQFPPDTQVFDNGNAKQYKVKSDGSMRELSKDGEELPGSVFQPGTPWYRRHQWLLVSFTLALAVVAAGVVYSKMKRRNPHGAGP